MKCVELMECFLPPWLIGTFSGNLDVLQGYGQVMAVGKLTQACSDAVDIPEFENPCTWTKI